MLTELSIRDFAIIDDISITFYDGLTIMTGETGAGKSIIIDAVELLTGGRGSIDFVRHNKKKAEITGLFYIESDQHHIRFIANQYEIELQDDMLVLERVITNQGKSICKINGKLVTLTILKKFGQALVTIHSQHDTIDLMDSKNHLHLLDQYNTEKINPIKSQYTKMYNELQSLQKEYKQLTQNEQHTIQRIDLLKFQVNEIEQANLLQHEDDHLNKERNHLHNFEKIYHAINETYYILYGDGKVLEQMNKAKDHLNEVGDADKQIESNAKEVTNIYYQLEEISFQLRDYNETLHFDEERLNEIESRLHEINNLKKKYGETVNEIIQYKETVSQELYTLENKDHHIEQLTNKIAEQIEVAKSEANKLHMARKKTAKQLMQDITEELRDLYLPNAQFSIQVNKGDDLHMEGLDDVQFMLSTNAGEPLKPLSKIASGGELSRIMLAMLKIFVQHDEVNTIIFDEIDTGVSGRVAQSIAEKMFEISKTTQVLGITHLAQVAAMSDNHLLIRKIEEKGHTSTTMNELSNNEKVEELAKMITGDQLTTSAMEHANQLLLLMNSYKTHALKS